MEQKKEILITKLIEAGFYKSENGHLHELTLEELLKEYQTLKMKPFC
ncbi:Fur-regulated basic protein FbpA [Fictibacillus enclensis]|uniref:Fur-regulated basic protein A n=1 Tax=Fictibacillus solisalsi TaxID=459525 RepID=A0A1G9XYF9_9BACL|nr:MULTISPECIES: Fur-regulated basic protein FbpA [Fictibacillus]MDM5200687.1 Fur-regulated basic protein FbpA [Fictibacillus enclensis]MDM5340043.1 Fur-regulated basic protein FbpA [Fictibacillus enclensis]RXZ01873.1 Fur-regulated basic protein FbpA [Fictibacillus sp. S7]WHY71568.1 Fur-regulated basic protein FbpA [Fictibacillus enclensis]SCC10444.1 Fur-regulated basic protein A [Fictibacillus enclensis]